MSTISLRQVTKRFATKTVVDAINLEIEDGQFVVLLGPSGCGKTTTLRMVAGLERQSEGEIRIGPRIVNDLSPRDRDVAMVFQNYALYPHKTVRGNLSFGLQMRRVPRAEVDRRVADVAQMLGLEEVLDRLPRQLSGGQQQRVALGRAVVREPAAFLLDEPLSNLDARLRVSTRTQIRALQRRLGTTTLYVTHDQEEAMTMADVIVVMNGGRIEQIGSPADVYDHPATRFVASFVGMPSMNFLRGALSGGEFVEGPAENGARFPIDPASSGHSYDLRSSGAVLLGLRPQALRLRRPGDAEGAVRGSIRAVEHLGEAVHVHFDTALHPGLVARLAPGDARDLCVDSGIELTVDPAGAHLFPPVPR